MSRIEEALGAIEEQQAREKGRTASWMAGEQLKDMIRREPEIAELICQDLTAGGMSLDKAEAKIKAYADKHRTGHFACVTPAEAEEILREYFGLPKASPHPALRDTFHQGKAGKGEIDLADFF